MLTSLFVSHRGSGFVFLAQPPHFFGSDRSSYANGFGFKTTKKFPIVTLGRILTTSVSAVFKRPEVAGISSPEAVPDAVERPGKLCLGPLRRDW